MRRGASQQPLASQLAPESSGGQCPAALCCPSEPHPGAGRLSLTREQPRLPIRYQLPVHRDISSPDQHFLWSHHHPGLRREGTVDEASASLPPTSSSCPVSIPISLPHQLTVPRLGTMAPGLEVDSPGGIGSSRQQVGAAAQEVVVVPVEGAVVEAGPGGTGGRGTRALAPELGHGPREGLQEGWRGRATWRTCTTVSICVWGRRAEEAGCGRTGMVTLVGRDREGTHLKGQGRGTDP